MAASSRPAGSDVRHRPPPWRDVRILRVGLQVAFAIAVFALVYWLFNNLTTNLARLGIRQDFAFLDQPAGFTILATEFESRQPIREALFAGFGNTLMVAIPGVLIALMAGMVVGIARLSANWLVRRAAGIYVELLRNIPPIVLITFFYFAVITQLPPIGEAIELAGSVLSNRGWWLPWITVDEGAHLFVIALAVAATAAAAVATWRTRRFDATGQPHHRVLWAVAVFVGLGLLAWIALDQPTEVTLPVREGRLVEGGVQLFPEYAALLLALLLYTSAFIAEIVRGSIQSVPLGQTEAASAVGLAWFDRMRYVVLPQALRVATPATGNEFLNLSKNVSLGLVIAYPELLRVARQAIGNGQPAPQLVAIALGGYLLLSLAISLLVNLANRRLRLVER